MNRRPNASPAPSVPAVLVTSLLAGLLLVAHPGGPAPAAAQAPEGGGGFDAALFRGLDYRMVGPTRGGRVTTVAGHPSHPHTFYMGSTGGGIWKTTDYGDTWVNVSDADLTTTASMGAIRVAPSDPDVIYAGTGSDGIRSNVVTGRGIYRSTDAGESWEFLGLRNTGQIGAVEVHPDNPDLAWVAALGHPFGRNEERGVYRTKDGGETWDRVLFVSDSVGAIDLELHPTDPRTIYATAWRGERKPWTIISGCGQGCGDGIWKSTDGGDEWEQVMTGEDFPEGLIGKIDLAVTPADPDRVYAVVEAKMPAEGLYRSDDRGETWRLVSNRDGLMDRPFYYTNVEAGPEDPDVVHVLSTRYYVSADAGESWERRRTPHGDNHDIWINPENPDIQVQSNDGGANVTLDGGETWSTQRNQPTAELYQVDVDDRFPYWLYAGQQDNTTIMVPSLPPAESAPAGPEGWWKEIGGCETGPAVPKPGDPTIVYANCKGRFGRYSHLTGQEKNYWVGGQYMYGRNPAKLEYRFQRTVPIEVSPHDPDVVYHGSQYVHRTTDDGVHWERISPDLTAFPAERQMRAGGPITNDITGEEHYSTLYVIEESPHEAGVIWAGSNDGPVHVTRDGGESWTDVTPPEMPPEGRINAIEISPHRPEKVYVAGYRFLLDDWRPYIWRTVDYGESWELLTPGDNGIPADHPVRVVREDPDREGLLYAGTEFGMYVSFDDGGRWQPLQLDLPVTPITDIEVHRKDLVLSTMGRGFWILDDLTPLHQLDRTVAASDAHLFRPRDAYRMRYFGGFLGYSGGGPSGPEYPGPGANIDYWLAEEPAGELTIEILDASGDVVRGFSSSDEGYRMEVTQGMRGPVAVTLGRPTPEKSPGMHRFRWDLRHPGAWSEDGGGRGGPMAVPGDYTVRISAGDWTETRPLRIRIDPRVEEDGTTVADLREQLEHNLQVRDAISEARMAAADVEEALDGDPPADVRTELEAIRGELVTPDRGSYPPPMLIDQLGYLYGMTARADQRPSEDARERYRELRSELDGLLRRLEDALGGMTGDG